MVITMTNYSNHFSNKTLYKIVERERFLLVQKLIRVDETESETKVNEKKNLIQGNF